MSIALFSAILTQILIFILPFVYSPFSRDTIEFPKHILIIIFAVIYLLLFAIKIWKHKTIEYFIKITDLPIIALAVVSTLSWLRVPNMLEILGTPGSIATLLSLTIIYLLIPSVTENRLKFNNILLTLQATSIALSIFVLLLRLNVFSNTPLNQFFGSGLVTPAGSITSTLALILSVFVATLITTLKNVKQINLNQKILNFSYLSISALIIIFSLFSILTSENKPLLPDLRASWQVAMESYKNPTYAIIGSGPGNYRNLYAATKPNFANLLPSWNVIFNTASNWYLTIFTETGMAGFLISCWLVVSVILTRKINAGTLSLLAILLIHPPTIILLSILFIVMAIEIPTLTVLRIPLSFNNSKISPLAVFSSIVVVIISLLFLYPAIQLSRAEYHINQAVNYSQNTTAQTTINHINEALLINPYASDYRVIASRASIAVAKQITSSGESLTEETQKDLTSAVSQAINKAQQAILLRSSAPNWENLSAIYQALIGSADKADQWTYVSLQEAMKRYPSNPTYYITAGQLFVRANNYPSAIASFMRAVELKPNHLNALFNLANAYKLNNEPNKAQAYLNEALKIAKPNSQEANQINEELQNISAQLPTPTPSTQTQPQVILNDDQAPPVEGDQPNNNLIPTSEAPSQITPTISPTPSITLNITPSITPTEVIDTSASDSAEQQ